MKILLIDPPFYRILGFYNRYFPVGITTVGTALKFKGYDVIIYDADFCDNPINIDLRKLPTFYSKYLNSFRNKNDIVWKEVYDVIKRYAPDIVGISLWTNNAASGFHISKICKEINPKCIVIMGGHHATVSANEVLNISPHVDFVVRGQGELTIIELIDHLQRKKSRFDDINGLSYRYDNIVKHNPDRIASWDIDEFPFPDRSLLMNEMKYTSEDLGLIMTSRGCPYNCTFCATNRDYRYRSIESVLDEVRFVKNKYGTSQFCFKDDTFSVNKKRVNEICFRLIKYNYNITWECNIRIDHINKEMLNYMRQAGCNSIKVGIESGSDRILKMINKGITTEQIINGAKKLNQLGMFWTAYFLIGIPGETIDDIYKTLNFMYKIKPNFASIGIFEPFPGTAMFNDGVKRGLFKEDMKLEDFYNIIPNNYYKIDPNRQVDTIDRETFNKVQDDIKMAFHRYNKRLVNICKRAISRINLYYNEPLLFAGDLIKYFRWK
jgi:anaerobic magnesium-protoporphyrin IX monomethyl ester cyclase